MDKEKSTIDIFEVIKKIRSKLNLSQEKLARELYMSFTSINKCENNKSKQN